MAADQKKTPASERIPLKLAPKDWAWPLAFMLSMSLVGLKFPLGYLFSVVILASRWRKDRYDFLIMLTLLLGGYGLSYLVSWGFNSLYYVTLIGLVGYCILKKNKLLNVSMLIWACYGLCLTGLALLSVVGVRWQMELILRYLSVIYFIIPLLVFSGVEFSMETFWRRLMPYILLMCIFYILDCIVFSGNLLVPTTHLSNDNVSTYNDLYWRPFTLHMHRKYPVGMYIVSLAVIPIVKRFKLSIWQWAVIVGGMVSTFTFSFISGIAMGFILFQSNKKRIGKLFLFGALLFTALYFIDSKLPYHDKGGAYSIPESTLRIKSSFDQIFSIFNIQDETDLARVGSNRMAQAIPKIELLYHENLEWTGFGFLTTLEHTPTKYIIYNDLYFSEYSENNWEVANNIEVSWLETFCSIGFIGLAVNILYFVLLWYTVRKLKYSYYLLSMIFIFAWLGVAGFEGLIRAQSLYLIGLVYGLILLCQRPNSIALNENAPA